MRPPTLDQQPQRQELEPRQHVQLAQGDPHHPVRRLVFAGQRLDAEPDARTHADARRRHRRPGQRDVHGHELPGRVDRRSHRRPCADALLTGRVTQIASSVRLDPEGQHIYMGQSRTDEQQDEIGLFVQDSWRLRPTLTVNAGLRWQVARPFQANLSVYSKNTVADLCGISGLGDGPDGRDCNLFNPGVFNPGGRVPCIYATPAIPATTPTTTTSPQRGRRLAAERAVRVAADDPWRPGPGHGSRRLRRFLQQRRSELLHRHLRCEPWQHDHDDALGDEHAVPAGASRESWPGCCCALRSG